MNARGNVHRCAECEGFPPRAAAHLANDYRPRVDADTHRKPRAVRRIEIVIAPTNRRNNLATGTHRACRIVLVCLRETEINQNTVAQKLGDIPSVAIDCLARACLISAHDFAIVFRIDARRQCRGSHQIAKHHSELATLRLDTDAARCWVLRRGWRRSLPNPFEHVAAARCDPLDRHQLLDQLLGCRVVNAELAFQYSERHTALLFKKGLCLSKCLEIGHLRPWRGQRYLCHGPKRMTNWRGTPGSAGIKRRV